MLMNNNLPLMSIPGLPYMTQQACNRTVLICKSQAIGEMQRHQALAWKIYLYKEVPLKGCLFVAALHKARCIEESHLEHCDSHDPCARIEGPLARNSTYTTTPWHWYSVCHWRMATTVPFSVSWEYLHNTYLHTVWLVQLCTLTSFREVKREQPVSFFVGHS